jgi:Rrf2 family protein
MLSQTVEYALRAVMHLASLPPGETANSESIATGTKVPKNYLSKILRGLVLSEIITSQRGPNGGFMLAHPSSEITLLQVINAVDPIQRIHKCPLNNPAHVHLCPLHRRLDEAIASIQQQFKCTRLSEVLETNVAAQQASQRPPDSSLLNGH